MEEDRYGRTEADRIIRQTFGNVVSSVDRERADFERAQDAQREQILAAFSLPVIRLFAEGSAVTDGAAAENRVITAGELATLDGLNGYMTHLGREFEACSREPDSGLAINLFVQQSAMPVASVRVQSDMPPPPQTSAGSVAECAGCGLDFVLPEAVPAFGQMACEYCAELREMRQRHPGQVPAASGRVRRPHLIGLVTMDLIMFAMVALAVLRIWL